MSRGTGMANTGYGYGYNTIQYGYNTVVSANTVLNTVVQYGCNTVLHGEWLPVRAPLLPVATHHANIHSCTAPDPHAGQLQSYAREKDAYCSHSPHIPHWGFFLSLRMAYRCIVIQYDTDTILYGVLGQYGPYWPTLPGHVVYR